MAKGTIGVTTENIFPVIKQFLYSDHDIFVRELVANAVDATLKLKALAVMAFISSELGWLPLYVVLLYLVFKKYKWQGLWVILGVVVLITCSDQLSSHVFKPIFHRFRPCHDPLIEDLVHLPYGHCGGQYGFISSHAANTFALATLIWLTMKRFYRNIGWLMFPWAALVAYSRIYMQGN